VEAVVVVVKTDRRLVLAPEAPEVAAQVAQAQETSQVYSLQMALQILAVAVVVAEQTPLTAETHRC